MGPEENPVVEAVPSAGDMPDGCTRCGKRLEDFVHIVYFGEWGGDSFKNEPGVRGWCRSCWGEHRAREKAAHYPVLG